MLGFEQVRAKLHPAFFNSIWRLNVTFRAPLFYALPFSTSSRSKRKLMISARKVFGISRGLQRLPHAGLFLRQARRFTYLGGSEVGFEVSGLGVLHGSNLTPDKETGLGGRVSSNAAASSQPSAGTISLCRSIELIRVEIRAG
jgi:hypothetical protein